MYSLDIAKNIWLGLVLLKRTGDLFDFFQQNNFLSFILGSFQLSLSISNIFGGLLSDLDSMLMSHLIFLLVSNISGSSCSKLLPLLFEFSLLFDSSGIFLEGNDLLTNWFLFFGVLLLLLFELSLLLFGLNRRVCNVGNLIERFSCQEKELLTTPNYGYYVSEFWRVDYLNGTLIP